MIISEIRNPDFFQSLCQQVIIAEYPDAQIVDDSRGDKGIDIYVPSTETLYAIYCPEKDTTQDKTIKDKIRGDIKKAAKLKEDGEYKIKNFVLMTPAPLKVDLQIYLKEQSEALNFETNQNLSEKHLIDILTKHQQLRSQFPSLIVPDLESQIESVHQSITAKLDKQHRQPNLTVEFADLKDYQALGKKIILTSKVIELPDQIKIPDYRTAILAPGENVNYYREVAKYIKKTALIKEIGFVIINLSDKVARDLAIEIDIPKSSDLVIQSNSNYPSFPKAGIMETGIDFSRILLANDCSISIRELKDKWIITANFKKVRPTEKVFSEIPFLISSNRQQMFKTVAIIRAENLSSPIKIPLEIEIKTSTEKLSVEDILDWEFAD